MGFFSGMLGNAFGSVLSSVGGSLLDKVVGGSSGSSGSGFDVGSLVGAGSNLLGGFLRSKSTEDANKANLEMAQAQLLWQQQYAKNRLQWQVEDAKKAGLHPLVAAGLSPVSFSPVSAQQSPIDYDWVGQAGQSLSYAAAKAKDQEQQRQAWQFQQELAQEQITGVRLDNELKVMQILSDLARLNQTGPAAPSLNPKTPIGGQNDATIGNSFSSGTTPLLSLSRVGNTLMGHINPDISDSLTEDMIRNQLANLNAEFQSGRITPEVYSHLTKHERDLIKKGDLVLEYSFPSTWRLRYTSRMKPKYANDNREVGGKLNFYHMKY